MSNPDFTKPNFIRDSAAAIKNDTEELANDAMGAVEETYEEMKTQGERFVALVSDFAAERPLATIGVAAVGGFLLAKLLRL